MVTAWEIPKNPLTDSTLDDSKLSKDIKWGFRIFTNTPTEAPHLAPSKVSCSNCHLNAGQRERSLPLVSVAGMFPDPMPYGLLLTRLAPSCLVSHLALA